MRKGRFIETVSELIRMFKCGDKCIGHLAADARLVRERTCLENAIKEKDLRGAKRAAQKIKETRAYIALMEEWPMATNLAIKPAILVDSLRPDAKRAAIMSQIQRVYETGINPINGKPLGAYGLTGIIIKYLIAKHDGKSLVREKRFFLTRDAINAIKYAVVACRGNPKATKFLSSLLEVK